jgi:hypothetical protein
MKETADLSGMMGIGTGQQGNAMGEGMTDNFRAGKGSAAHCQTGCVYFKPGTLSGHILKKGIYQVQVVRRQYNAGNMAQGCIEMADDLTVKSPVGLDEFLEIVIENTFRADPGKFFKLVRVVADHVQMTAAIPIKMVGDSPPLPGKGDEQILQVVNRIRVPADFNPGNYADTAAKPALQAGSSGKVFLKIMSAQPGPAPGLDAHFKMFKKNNGMEAAPDGGSDVVCHAAAGMPAQSGMDMTVYPDIKK